MTVQSGSEIAGNKNPATTSQTVATTLIALGLGNSIAFYDLLIFGLFSVQISKVIYPESSASTQLLLTLGTFGVGLLTRPIGALLIGRFADTRGRKPAMLLSFSLIGIAMLGQAVVPPYAAVGLAAPLLMLFFRLLLGFAIGGEVGPSITYLVETAPPNRRGLYASVQYATQDVGVLLAGMVGYACATLLDDWQLANWGWRIAMLFGVLIIPFGIVLRRRLDETLDSSRPTTTISEAMNVTRTIALGFGISASATVIFYGISYLNIYAQTYLNLTAAKAFGSTVMYGLASICFTVLGGLISDRIGRKPVMLAGIVLATISIYPAYLWLQAVRSPFALGAVSFGLSALTTLGFSAAITAITEALPPQKRAVTLGLIYSLAVTVFGGSTQFLITWLTQATGNPLTPAYYVLAAAVVGLTAMMMFPETAPRRVNARGTGQCSPSPSPEG